MSCLEGRWGFGGGGRPPLFKQGLGRGGNGNPLPGKVLEGHPLLGKGLTAFPFPGQVRKTPFLLKKGRAESPPFPGRCGKSISLHGKRREGSPPFPGTEMPFLRRGTGAGLPPHPPSLSPSPHPPPSSPEQRKRSIPSNTRVP